MLYTTNTFIGYNNPVKEADVVFLGIPFSSTNLSSSSIYGPLMVRESLKLVDGNTTKGNVFDRFKICDVGDVEIVAGSYELTAQRIRETIAEIRKNNPSAFLVVIGGEHLVTLPLVEALKPNSVVQLDAHGDTYPDYMGVTYSHATWAYHAARIAPVHQIGVRHGDNVPGVASIHTSSLSSIVGPTHLTIDVDVFSPGLIGETGMYEGVLAENDVLDVIGNLSFSSMDVVEIADRTLPSKSGFLAAKLIVAALAKRL